VANNYVADASYGNAVNDNIKKIIFEGDVNNSTNGPYIDNFISMNSSSFAGNSALNFVEFSNVNVGVSASAGAIGNAFSMCPNLKSIKYSDLAFNQAVSRTENYAVTTTNHRYVGCINLENISLPNYFKKFDSAISFGPGPKLRDI
jgi:hypothetical protein